MPESYFSIVASLRPATLLKKRHRHRRFPVNFEETLRTPFYRISLAAASEHMDDTGIVYLNVWVNLLKNISVSCSNLYDSYFIKKTIHLLVY